MIGTCTIGMALTGLMIVLCFFFILIDIYLALGIIFPELNIKIEQKIRKALNKPPIIILDPWYIRERNSKWVIWIFALSLVFIFAILFIIRLIE